MDQICGLRSVPLNCVFLRPTPLKQYLDKETQTLGTDFLLKGYLY